jgi:hypothetical protein
MAKTLGALGILGALSAALFYLQAQPEKGAPKPRPRPFAALPAERVGKIEVTQKTEKVVLARRDAESFRVAEPVDVPADDYAVKQLLDRLSKIDFARVVTDKADRHAEFEVDADKGARVRVFDVDGVLKADFRVGKVSNGQTMIRPEGKPEVYAAVGTLKYVFAKELRNWRDKEILEFDKDKAKRIEVAGPQGTVALELAAKGAAKEGEPGQDTWKVAAAPIAIDRLDEGVASGLLSSLYRLRASDFADGAEPAEVGLEPARTTVTVTLEDGTAHTLLVGDKKGEDTYVKRPDRDQVFALKDYTADRIALPPADFRDKTVTELAKDDVVEVAIDKGGARLKLSREDGSWKAEPAVDPLDTARVDSAVGGLTSIKAARFSAERDPKTTGLAAPSGTATVKLKDGSKVTLRVGAAIEDDEVYLARAGSPEVYVVKKYVAERFLKTAEDFKKKP